MEEENEVVIVKNVYGDICIRKARRKRQKLLVKELVLDYANNTTLHGLPYVTRRGLTIIEKIFWFLTFLTSVSLCLFLISKVWFKWQSSPVIVTVSERLVPVSMIPFPSVTICPQSKVRASLYNYTAENLYVEKFMSENYDPINKTMRDRIAKFADISQICHSFENIDYSEIYPNNYSDSTVYENIHDVALKFDDVFFLCFVAGEYVSCDDYFDEVVTKEGICYNMNSLAASEIFRKKNLQTHYQYLKANKTSKGWSIEDGYDGSFNDIKKRKEPDTHKARAPMTGGVNITSDNSQNETFVNQTFEDWLIKGYNESDIFVNQSDVNRTSSSGSSSYNYYTSEQKESYYPLPGIEDGASPDVEIILKDRRNERDDLCNIINSGFKVYIQHPTDFPQSSLYYYAILNSQVSSMALSFSILNTSESLRGYDPEVRQCYFPDERYLQYFSIYTSKNCMAECVSNITFEICGCVQFYMPHSTHNKVCTASQQYCVLYAREQMVHRESDPNDRKCHCLPSCNTMDYEAEILKTEYKLQQLYKVNSRMYNYSSLDLDGVQFSKLEMYFKRPRFLSMRRSELFGIIDFLANCGGLLGLFLGFSFLSLVEIFYFLTLRLCCTLKKDLEAEKGLEVNGKEIHVE